jgi:hypothetical protein
MAIRILPKMALAAVTQPDDQKVLVFYNTMERNLALEVRDGFTVSANYENCDPNATGLVQYATSLAPLQLDG